MSESETPRKLKKYASHHPASVVYQDQTLFSLGVHLEALLV